MKKRCVSRRQPVGDRLLLRALEGQRIMQRAGDQVGSVERICNSSLGTCATVTSPHTARRGGGRSSRSAKLRPKPNSSSTGAPAPAFETKLGTNIISRARDTSNRPSPSGIRGLAPGAAFPLGLDHNLLVRIIQHADADVVVCEAKLQFGAIRASISSGLSVASRCAKHYSARSDGATSSVRPEEPGVFERDGCLAGKHAHQLEVAGIVDAFCLLCTAISRWHDRGRTNGTPQKQPRCCTGSMPSRCMDSAKFSRIRSA